MRFVHQLALLLLIIVAGCTTARPGVDRSRYLIGYSTMRCDDPRGQFYNWRTQRAMIVRADGHGRREIGRSLITKPDGWTQFAGWWPDGKQASVLSCWENEPNYTWEREHRTFRMTQDWLVDCCLVDLKTGGSRNLTAVDRVSIYNTGLFPWPGDSSRVGFTALLAGESHPFAMDVDGRHKQDLTTGQAGFTYGFSASPDGRRVAYHTDYKIYVADADGSNARRVDNEHAFQFGPTWSPEGKWLLFLAGEHYDCHPHVVSADGGGLRQLAHRGGYKGIVEVLNVPDFHSASSDVPIWAPDSESVYYTAQVGEAVELMRVHLSGEIEQLTHSAAGVLQFHPRISDDGRLIAFGSTRDGARALYVAEADGSRSQPITPPRPGWADMHAWWKPILAQSCHESPH